MESFNLGNLFQSYLSIFYKVATIYETKRVAYNLVLPLIFSVFILVIGDSIDSIKDSVALILSILVGLLFNFIASFSEKLKSEHLSQNITKKIKRLDLISETSDAAFVTIILSLFGLTIIMLLTIISGIEFIEVKKIKNILDVFLGSLCLVSLYQIFLMLIYMANRLRALINVDSKQEMKNLKKLQEEDIENYKSLN